MYGAYTDTPETRLPMLRQNVLRHGYAPCFVQPAFPLGWAKMARQVLIEYAQPPAGADLRILPGDHLMEELLPWLHHWYTDIAILYAGIAFSMRITYPASLSLSCIQGKDAPAKVLEPLYGTALLGLSGILFLDTLPEGVGGHLALAPPGKAAVSILPQEGLFVLFDRQVGVTFTPLAPDFSLSIAILDYYYANVMGVMEVSAR